MCSDFFLMYDLIFFFYWMSVDVGIIMSVGGGLSSFVIIFFILARFRIYVFFFVSNIDMYCIVFFIFILFVNIFFFVLLFLLLYIYCNFLCWNFNNGRVNVRGVFIGFIVGRRKNFSFVMFNVVFLIFGWFGDSIVVSNIFWFLFFSVFNLCMCVFSFFFVIFFAR